VTVSAYDLHTAPRCRSTYAPDRGEWYGADKRPDGGIDVQDMLVWLNSWHFRRDFPSWRAGDRPMFFPWISALRESYGHPTERNAGTGPDAGDGPPVPSCGTQVLSGVEFD